MNQPRTQRPLAPSSGYPVQVKRDGTITLTVAGRLRVDGMNLPQLNEADRSLVVGKELLTADPAVISVSLIQPRTYALLVLLLEATGFGTGPCQGKECLAPVATQLARLTQIAPASIRPFTSRPPLAPTPLRILARAPDAPRVADDEDP